MERNGTWMYHPAGSGRRHLRICVHNRRRKLQLLPGHVTNAANGIEYTRRVKASTANHKVAKHQSIDAPRVEIDITSTGQSVES